MTLTAAVARLLRGNATDPLEWDDDHEDEHLCRRGPVLVTSIGTVWAAMRAAEVEAPGRPSAEVAEWGARLRADVEARREARRPQRARPWSWWKQ